jgi:hypothetical protein
MSPGNGAEPRTLIVLADGVQAAFAAGAVAELARAGARWDEAWGAGLGAQVAVLAALGEADEAARRWRRQGELGCPLLQSRVAVLRERLADAGGILVVPDPFRADGWLDGEVLDEHLAPERADLPGRLRGVGARASVAVADLESGLTEWVALDRAAAADAGALLAAAATFAAGWGPRRVSAGGRERLIVGGVGGLPIIAPAGALARPCDLVCGFPVPAVARPGVAGALLEAVQRRDECRAAELVAAWGGGARLLAPTPAAYRGWAARDNAELGVEWPLPTERNGELAGLLLEFGAAVARTALESGR